MASAEDDCAKMNRVKLKRPQVTLSERQSVGVYNLDQDYRPIAIPLLQHVDENRVEYESGC